MSIFVGSRTSLQCRSHHQKMIKLKGNVLSIIEYFEAEERFASRDISFNTMIYKENNSTPNASIKLLDLS